MFAIIKQFLLLALAISVFGAAPNSIGNDKTEVQTTKVLLMTDVKWTPLNPARGALGPKAGNLWGDRTGVGPSGFLVKFIDGFSSPPHIHNVTYRGIVISGHIHNDDPNAEKMWMSSGSFWTQPAGETHITAAKGSNNLAYIEIDNGPYLVLSTNEAFDRGEKPINVDESNLVWINQSGVSANANEPVMAYLWGKPHGGQMYGTLIKLPAGLTTKIISKGSTFHSVVIKGQLQYHVSETEVKNMEQGSYFNSSERSDHKISSKKERDTIIYVRTNGMLDLTH